MSWQRGVTGIIAEGSIIIEGGEVGEVCPYTAHIGGQKNEILRGLTLPSPPLETKKNTVTTVTKVGECFGTYPSPGRKSKGNKKADGLFGLGYQLQGVHGDMFGS